jgi:hypothetical protein
MRGYISVRVSTPTDSILRLGEKVHSRPSFTAALNYGVRREDTLQLDRNIAQASDLEIGDRLRLAQSTQRP